MMPAGVLHFSVNSTQSVFQASSKYSLKDYIQHWWMGWTGPGRHLESGVPADVFLDKLVETLLVRG